jgi:hypothetical protein
MRSSSPNARRGTDRGCSRTKAATRRRARGHASDNRDGGTGLDERSVADAIVQRGRAPHECDPSVEFWVPARATVRVASKAEPRSGSECD